ncbi:MAG: MATE family efflux transporter [Mycoplasmatales bacterium]
MNKNLRTIYQLFWPIAITMFLTNILSLIDAMMLTNYNVLAISAVAISGQIQFIFGPIYFAIMTGINIYSVQYYAREEYSKLKKFAGIAFTMLVPVAVINFLLIVFFDQEIVALFAKSSEELTSLSLEYLFYFKYSAFLIPLEMFFMYQYRAIKRPKISLYISIIQALVNIGLNYLLIYGNFGFAELGVTGAALATLIAKIIAISGYIGLSIKLKVQFIGKIKEMIGFNYQLFKDVFLNTLPLLVVEFGFGFGNVIYTKIYAETSTIEFTAFNVARSTSLTLNALVIGSASVAAIYMGSVLSTFKKEEELRSGLKQLWKFLWINSIVTLGLSIIVLPKLTFLFGATHEQTEMLNILIPINGIWMAIRVFASSLIAILKAGNDNKFVMLVDAGSTFLVGVPITLLGLLFLGPNIYYLRLLIIIEVLVKVGLGYYRYRLGFWIKRI